MLAFPLVLRRRVEKLRRARARWQKVRYAIKVHFAISHHAAAHVPPPPRSRSRRCRRSRRASARSAAVAAATAAICSRRPAPLGRGGFGEVYLSASRTHVLKFVPVAPGSPPSFERQIAAESGAPRPPAHCQPRGPDAAARRHRLRGLPLVLTNQLKVGRALPATPSTLSSSAH